MKIPPGGAVLGSGTRFRARSGYQDPAADARRYSSGSVAGGILGFQQRQAPPLAALTGLLTLASACARHRGTGGLGGGRCGPRQEEPEGWIHQLTHLYPNTPPVDIYLYSFGNAKAMIGVLQALRLRAVYPLGGVDQR